MFLARIKSDGRYYALKQLPITQIGEKNPDVFLREWDALIKVDDPFVVKLYAAFQNENYYYFVLDFVPGSDLAELRKLVVKFCEAEARLHITESLLALEALP